MEGSLLLDVVVAQGTAVFELLPGEYQALLVRRDALLFLDPGRDIQWTGVLLDVVIGRSAIIFQFLPGENEPLLLRKGPSLSSIMALTISMMSPRFTSNVIISPIKVFTKICMVH